MALEDVMITGNGRYGVLADGAVYINSDPSNNTVISPTSTTTSAISARFSVNASAVALRDACVRFSGEQHGVSPQTLVVR